MKRPRQGAKAQLAAIRRGAVDALARLLPCVAAAAAHSPDEEWRAQSASMSLACCAIQLAARWDDARAMLAAVWPVPAALQRQHPAPRLRLLLLNLLAVSRAVAQRGTSGTALQAQAVSLAAPEPAAAAPAAEAASEPAAAAAAVDAEPAGTAARAAAEPACSTAADAAAAAATVPVGASPAEAAAETAASNAASRRRPPRQQRQPPQPTPGCRSYCWCVLVKSRLCKGVMLPHWRMRAKLHTSMRRLHVGSAARHASQSGPGLQPAGDRSADAAAAAGSCWVATSCAAC